MTDDVTIKPTTKTTLVTPQKAERWLRKNAVNRNLRPSIVAKYARDMAADKWDLNGEAIILAQDGTLLNGQHRLHACVKTDAPFWSLICIGVPLSAMKNLDTGEKRSFADRLRLEGVEHHHKQHGALVALFHEYLYTRSAGYPSREELSTTNAKYFAEIAEAVDFAVSCRIHGVPMPLNMSSCCLAFLLFRRCAVKPAEEYISQCIAGEGISRTDAAWSVRAKVQRAREQGQQVTPKDQIALLIRGWNAVRSQRSFSKAYARGKGPDAKNWRTLPVHK